MGEIKSTTMMHALNANSGLVSEFYADLQKDSGSVSVVLWKSIGCKITHIQKVQN